MRPISDIHINDRYQRPNPHKSIIYLVSEIDKEEKMIKIKIFNKNKKEILNPVWIDNKNGLFKKRVFNGLTNKDEIDFGEKT